VSAMGARRPFVRLLDLRVFVIRDDQLLLYLSKKRCSSSLSPMMTRSMPAGSVRAGSGWMTLPCWRIASRLQPVDSRSPDVIYVLPTS
jgi:hypothetical protein